MAMVGCRHARGESRIKVTAADRARLEAMVADRNRPQTHVWRARIILASADGCGTAAVMRRAGVSKPSVGRWQERFMREGVDGLVHDKTRPSRIPPLPQAIVEAMVTRTLEEAPPGQATHWTAPAMATASGLSVSSVQRIWRAHGLRPHQTRTFKLSTDPKFAAKIEDIVGLYVDPPAHAVVLSIDEKSHVWMAPCSQEKVGVWHNRVALRSCVRPVDAVVA